MRIEKISEIIESRGRVSLDELSERFKNVSTMTLRRDLIYLENKGEIIRVRGGAVSVNELQKKTEDYFFQRTLKNVAEKKIIAEKAAKLIQPEQSVFIDSGSTSYYFVKQLLDVNYTIITNGINIALELSRKSMPSITVLGGLLSRNNFATSGGAACDLLENLNIDTAFLNTTAFTLEGGFTCGSPSESDIKKLILRKASRKIMLMDSSKLNKIMPYTFASLSEIDVLVSDGKLTNRILEEARKIGVTVL
jgi:DeoR/GlpR family transcriptional regulator of sugar metabolism